MPKSLPKGFTVDEDIAVPSGFTLDEPTSLVQRALSSEPVTPEVEASRQRSLEDVGADVKTFAPIAAGVTAGLSTGGLGLIPAAVIGSGATLAGGVAGIQAEKAITGEPLVPTGEAISQSLPEAGIAGASEVLFRGGGKAAVKLAEKVAPHFKSFIKGGNERIRQIIRPSEDAVNLANLVEKNKSSLPKGLLEELDDKGISPLSVASMTDNRIIEWVDNILSAFPESQRVKGVQKAIQRATIQNEFEKLQLVTVKNALTDEELSATIKSELRGELKSIVKNLRGKKAAGGKLDPNLQASINKMEEQFLERAKIEYSLVDKLTGAEFSSDIIGRSTQISGASVNISETVDLANRLTQKGFSPSSKIVGRGSATPSTPARTSKVKGAIITRPATPSIPASDGTVITRKGQRVGILSGLSGDALSRRAANIVSESPDFMTFGEAQSLRSKLIKLSRESSSNSDRDIISKLIRGVDNSMTSESSGLTGEALKQFRAANAMFKEGASGFADKTIKKIMVGDPDTVASTLLTGKRGELVGKVKKILGGDSDEWNLVRDAYIDKMLDTKIPLQNVEDVKKALSTFSKSSKVALKEILDPADLKVWNSVMKTEGDRVQFIQSVLSKSTSSNVIDAIIDNADPTISKFIRKSVSPETAQQIEEKIYSNILTKFGGTETFIGNSGVTIQQQTIRATQALSFLEDSNRSASLAPLTSRVRLAKFKKVLKASELFDKKHGGSGQLTGQIIQSGMISKVVNAVPKAAGDLTRGDAGGAIGGIVSSMAKLLGFINGGNKMVKFMNSPSALKQFTTMLSTSPTSPEFNQKVIRLLRGLGISAREVTRASAIGVTGEATQDN